MRKWIAILTGLSFSLALMACGAKEPQVIPVVGTGSGAKILESVCSSFSDKNKDVVFTVPESIGSGGGIKAVGADKNMIGRVARKLKDKEKPLGLTYTPIAKMPIVFFVHSGVHVNDLTTQQVCDVYAGKIKNWKEVGGGDMAIRVVRREKDDSSYKELQKSFPGFGTLAITLDSELTLSDPETLEYVKATAGAIAFGTYGNATGARVNVLNINGVEPLAEDYPYFGTLALIYKESNKKGDVAEFVAFATTGPGRESIFKAGGKPF